MKTQTQRYELWNYEVWGNDDEGYWVNNQWEAGTIILRVKQQIFNPGTPQEFTAYDPTDRQLNRAIGVSCNWEGESAYTLYANDKSNGAPVCELRRIS